MSDKPLSPLRTAEVDVIRERLIDLAGIGTYRYRDDGTIVYMDRTTLRLLEVDHLYPEPEMVKDKNISDLFIYVRAPSSLRAEMKRKGRISGFEYPFRTLDGKLKWSLHDSYQVQDPITGEISYQVIARDITPLKRAQAQLEQTNRELARYNEELRSLDEMKTNLLASISHELRSPLVSVRGYAELIASGVSGPVTETQQKQLEVIQRSVTRVVDLINDLLDFSSLSQGKVTLQRAPCDLNQLVRDVVTSLRPRLERKGLTVDDKLCPGELTVEADGRRMGQVVTNLLDNALKFTPEGGTITVSSRELDAQRAEVSVEDTGVGIPEDKAHLIFQQFYQADSTHSRRFSGLGLGLSICKSIVLQHGGAIRARSARGEGTTVTFALPTRWLDEVTQPELPAVPTPEAGTALWGEQPERPLRVVVVDDDADIGHYFCEVLALNGLEPVFCRGGPAALNTLAETPADAVLLDITMPGMDGFEVCRRIRKMPGGARIPIVMVSATPGQVSRKRALEAGADRFLAKPCTAQQLVGAVLRSHRRRNRSAGGDPSGAPPTPAGQQNPLVP